MKKIKKSVFLGIMLILLWSIVELLSFLGSSFIHRTFFSPQKVLLRLSKSTYIEEIAVKNGEREFFDLGDNFIEAIHPYWGFSADPFKNDKDWEVSEFGFLWSKGVNPILKKSSEKFIIGIFGGSFATQFYRYSAFRRFQDCLKRQRKKVIVLNFAAGGYKQPQQLLILTSLLSLGAEFDLIVNIDGFNEVALPPAENIPNAVYPFYPRMWHARAKYTLNYEEIKQRGHIEFLKSQKMEWAKLFYTYRLYWSPTFSILWEYRDRFLSRKIEELQRNMLKSNVTSRQYEMQGPEYHYSNDEQLFTDLAKNWSQSSLQMKNLCDTNGIAYYHFLQPNQYVEGSKPMSGQEKIVALSKTEPYKFGVIHGYPLLKNYGKWLVDKGVNWTDLTMLFVNHHEVLYDDNCCHLNKTGYDLIFDRICQTISQKQGKNNRE